MSNMLCGRMRIGNVTYLDLGIAHKSSVLPYLETNSGMNIMRQESNVILAQLHGSHRRLDTARMLTVQSCEFY